ncbi:MULTISPECIES: methionine biosynthesis protein MetW [Gulbenkiania]|uniref:Methionine biosynthesis protein MetW n=2 Tax=Gulbenkiania TaxID=397456 RepID=A0A0K6GSZ4_9NEIS|nr:MULTISPECIES: methionine biosynthesis protein MetW [Gulbenkiania]TCW31725.1 methionine biosynthesis protein MetW [Gulbenkiania mobilis]CUA81850.1 methionine biosynthesis protein MetW [Gulbenkiania indica]
MSAPNTALRPDLQLIADWITPGSRVLDLGCGQGELLAWLKTHKQVKGYGVDLEVANIVACVAAGVDAIQGDLETGLADFGDATFDHVILSQTIQAMRHTEEILNEMLRVGREAIVTFPNFGYWQNRLQILKGHMPVSETIPFEWYNTPNIHWCMLGDFENLCAKNGVRVAERVVMDQGRRVHWLPNLLGSLAFYRVTRAPGRAKA